MVDYEASPGRQGMDVNMITFSADYSIIGEDEEVMAQFSFKPRDAVFAKLTEPVNHLKPLYLWGHIYGAPVSRMLVDGGALVNLMPYELYKKLGKSDTELVKTNMTLSGVRGKKPIEAKGVTSMELTIGSKMIATAFFVAEVEGNYSLILGRDWIHANQCVPSTLHQFLIQWVRDEIEMVHADSLACVAAADAPVIWTYDNAKCLTRVDLSDYQFLSVSKEGFIPVMLESVENRLNHII
jgi:hypothetical protein